MTINSAIESLKKNKESKKGFTLLELLIVISIIAVLAVILVIVLNPVETLKKSRDTQRISDLGTLKTAVGIYTTSKANPYLAGATSNTACKSGTGGGAYNASEDKIFYSYPTDSTGAPVTDTSLDGTNFVSPGGASQVTNDNLSLTDGNGWFPVNFNSLAGGSPISNLPVDPTNVIESPGSVAYTDLVYRYACNSDGGSLTYEIDARLESSAYTTDDNKMTKDGGDNVNYYEVGTNLKVLGTGTDF